MPAEPAPPASEETRPFAAENKDFQAAARKAGEADIRMSGKVAVIK